jgi:type II secretory pathway pseudopilin PulG
MTPSLHRSGRGFTLIEMIITLCVFILLAGAVFSIFSATLESASSLQDDLGRNDEITALRAWLTASLIDIPASGSFTSYQRAGIPFHVTGVIWGANDDLQALDLQLQPNGEYTLRLAVYQPDAVPALWNGQAPQAASIFLNQVQRDDGSLAWRPLVRDLKSADWRFLPLNQTEWQLIASGTKPAIAEFTFQLGGSAAAITDDFWIPPTVPASSPAFAPAPATASINNP